MQSSFRTHTGMPDLSDSPLVSSSHDVPHKQWNICKGQDMSIQSAATSAEPTRVQLT